MDDKQLREISLRFVERLETAGFSFIDSDTELRKRIDDLVFESPDVNLSEDQYEALKKFMREEVAERETIKTESETVATEEVETVEDDEDDEDDEDAWEAEKVEQMAEEVWRIGQRIKTLKSHLSYRQDCLTIEQIIAPALKKVSRQEPLTIDEVEDLDRQLFLHGAELAALSYG